MLFKRLYKLNSDGKTSQLWEIHYENDEYFTISGQVKGKKVTSAKTKVIPKVKRTLQQQIELEMNSLINKKRDNRYVENLEDIENAEGNLPGFSPMLAKDWLDHKKKVIFPCAVQPKLDGVRCVITKEGMFSRKRKQFSSCPHIWNELKILFDNIPNLKLDGELYSHDFKDDFENIISAVRKTSEKASEDDLKFQENISFFIYDIPSIFNLNENDPFNVRHNLFNSVFEKYKNNLKHIKVLETFYIHKENEINNFHDNFVSNGYEGLMIRNSNAPYEGKRTHNLLKVKIFKEEEFEITKVNEGDGGLSGHAATFTFVMPDGKVFDAKMEGSFDRLKWIYQNPQEVVGKMGTVKYFKLTKRGVPKFGTVKTVRGLKDQSDWL